MFWVTVGYFRITVESAILAGWQAPQNQNLTLTMETALAKCTTQMNDRVSSIEAKLDSSQKTQADAMQKMSHEVGTLKKGLAELRKERDDNRSVASSTRTALLVWGSGRFIHFAFKTVNLVCPFPCFQDRILSRLH
jgi:alanyl-tRNA synthetase